MADQEWCSMVQRHVESGAIELCKTNQPSPTYAVDQTLKQHGHVAIRLPPYHAELNSIELIWAKL